MMKKLSLFIAILFLVFGSATSASALTYGIGYSVLDLNYYDTDTAVKSYNSNLGMYENGGAEGTFSAGIAAAYSDGDFDADYYYGSVMNDWAVAYTDNSFAAAAFYEGYTGSVAAARAGDGYGEEAGAVAGTFVAAYGLYMTEGAEVSFAIDYAIGAEIGAAEDGFAAAGAAALFGIYQDGEINGDLDIVSLYGSYMYDYDEESGVLEFTTWLDKGYYTIFAGTAAWAHAYESVPEPSTMVLLGIGLIGIAGFGRKKFL